jgi:Bacterial regulatory proteins, gntR family
MELLVAPSKTEQITAILRSQIKKGYYRPGSKLTGMRQLAKKFNVSTRIVGCALDNLQQERLLRSEHGRGVFIEQWTDNDITNVYMLFWGISERSNNYFEEFAKIAYPPIMPSDFSFNLRAVLKNSDEFHHLDAELARIDNSPDVNCAIFSAAMFNSEHIKKFKQLQCPFIMLGDFASASFNNFDCNQITGDIYKEGQYCLEFMNKHGYKEVSLLTLNTKLFFYEQFCNGVKDAAKAANIKINVLEMAEDVHHYLNTGADIKKKYEQHFSEVSSAFFDVPLIVTGLREKILIEILSEQNKLSGDLPVILPNFDSKYLSEFYKAVFKMIKKVVKQPQNHHKELIDVPFIMNDLVTGEKYLNNQGEISKIS